MRNPHLLFGFAGFRRRQRSACNLTSVSPSRPIHPHVKEPIALYRRDGILTIYTDEQDRNEIFGNQCGIIVCRGDLNEQVLAGMHPNLSFLRGGCCNGRSITDALPMA